MRCDYQNLNDGEPPRYWRHGRAWLRPSGEWWNRRTLRVEWTIPVGHCGWGVTLGGGDDGRNLGCTLAIPFLATLYISVERFFSRRLFEWNMDRGENRQIAVSFHDGAIWYSLWAGSSASWSRDYPWCKWWRQGSFHFAALLGRQQYSCEVIKADIPVTIPMPEGVYRGTAKIERATWKRPLWFAHTRISTTIDVPKGIPFQGKGENSWDCGDDGLFGWGADGKSVEKAIGHGVEIVLTNRRRYGMPSDSAIAEARRG